MSVVGKSLGVTRNNGKLINFSIMFDKTLDTVGLSKISKESRLKNEKLNKTLCFFDYDIECLKLYLYERGYELIKIFRNEYVFKKYVRENRIKMKIKNGEILIGNIYGEEDFLKCVGIVLVTEIDTVDKQVNNILEK